MLLKDRGGGGCNAESRQTKPKAQVVGENAICGPRVTKRGKGITEGRDIDSDEESAGRREGEKIAHQHGKPRGMWEYVAIKRPWVKTI